MDKPKSAARWLVLAGLILLILAVFLARTLLAALGMAVPRLFELFDSLTMLGALLLTIRYLHRLTRLDWMISLGLGLVIGALLPFATLFSPFPFWGVNGGVLEAFLRGLKVTIPMLGGLAVMRSGGPVQPRLADGNWKGAVRDFGFGALVGIPLAIINIFALRMTGGQPFVLQNLLAAVIDALQPAVVEEAIYRLAFLGLVWWLLKGWWGAKAVTIAAALSVLVHSYAHLDQLLIDNPLFGLGYGAVMALLWGLPIVLLAVRRSWEAGTGFHWMQDALRFQVGL